MIKEIHPYRITLEEISQSSKIVKRLTGDYLEDESYLFFKIRYSLINNPGNIDPLSSISLNKQLYSKLTTIFSFRFNDYVEIKVGDQINNPEGFFFDKSFSIVPYNEVLFYFKKSKNRNYENFTILVKDIGFNIGNLDFKIRK